MISKILDQTERMSNLSDKIKKELEEVEKSGYQIEDYSYPSEPQGELPDWEEYEKSLDKNEVTQLILKPNTYKFKNNKLDLKDYPKLITIYAAGLGLEDISLSNLPKLQSLILIINKLKQIGGLEELTSLVSLSIGKNHFSVFDFSTLKNLKSLICNANPYIGAKGEKSLIVYGLENLEYLDCSDSKITELILDGCLKLKILDGDINNIVNLDFPLLPELELLSLKNNKDYDPSLAERRILTLQSHNLKFLVYKGSNIRKVVHKSALNHQLEVLNDKTSKEIYKDLSTEEMMQLWEKVVDETIANSNELDMIRHLFGDTHIDHKAKEKEIEAQLATDEQENSNPLITDPSLLTNDYPDLIKPNSQEETLTHKFLIGTLIVEDKPNLTSLNIGNNYLSYLVVRNCPKLHTLRYPHNKLKQDAFIDQKTCSNITTIDKENYDGKKVWNEVGEELFNKGELKPQINIDKQQKKEPTEEDKITARIVLLLEQAETALADQNYPQLEQLINEMNELVNKLVDVATANRMRDKIAKFEQALLVQTSSTQDKNIWPLIIMLIIIVPIILGIFILLAKKWIISDIEKSLK